MTRHRRSATGLALVVSLGLGACAGLPIEEFNDYNLAFDKAREASVDVYAELIPAFDRAANAPGGRFETGDVAKPQTQTRTPTESDLVAFTSASPGARTSSLAPSGYGSALDGDPFADSFDCAQFEKHRALLVRCQSFALVTRYNALIVSLNSGAPQDVVKREIGGVIALLQPIKFFAGAFAGPIAGVGVGELIDILDAALDSQEKHEILLKLREGLPKIQQFITLLKDDVTLMRDAKRVHAEILLSERELKVQTAHDTFAARFQGFARPSAAGGVEIVELYDKVDADYLTALRKMSGAKGFDASEQLRLRESWPRTDNFAEYGERILRYLKAFEGAVADFEQITADWRKYKEALARYDAMLDRLSDATDELRGNTLSDLDLSVLGPLNPLTLLGRGDDGGPPSGFKGILADIFAQADSIQKLLASPG